MEKAKLKEHINRALGWLEGISFGVDSSVAAGIIDAVELIENTIEEYLKEESK